MRESTRWRIVGWAYFLLSAGMPLVGWESHVSFQDHIMVFVMLICTAAVLRAIEDRP